MSDTMIETQDSQWRHRLRNPWACSRYALLTTLFGFVALFLMAQSFLTRQLDVKGCEMAYMWPTYAKFDQFDDEHTRFAGKYSLHIYREGGMNDDFTVKGVPVLFIPGNAGSYKQVRSFASEAAYHYHNNILPHLGSSETNKRPLDFFSVDFNEDFTAFHGQTLLDQAEYLNDAITYILSLYHTPGYFNRDSNLPDPTSVIIVGHSMGGVVARTMLTMPNYQANSINTIVTLAAPHARPPISFDGDMIRIYKGVNEYWRHAYSQISATDNPLWHVTLISIAGGSLDTLVPSDYASIESIVPETHGFTVFTSSMPHVWTGMDHLAITWCDQNRKSIIRALYDVVDVSRATQTIPRTQRMRAFKRWILSGLEDIVENNLFHEKAEAFVALDESTTVVSQNERLALKSLGQAERKPNTYLLPIPSQNTPGWKFTLLTNEMLASTDEHSLLEVLFCSLPSSQSNQPASTSSVVMPDSNDRSSAKKLACKHATPDVIALPASTRDSTFPFRTDQQPFSYIQYDLENLKEYEFIAIVDKATQPHAGWVFAEFSSTASSLVKVEKSLEQLLLSGLSFRFPANHPLMVDIKIPALHSSLLAYNLRVGGQSCGEREVFAPIFRQYITNVYESKFFVNVKDANINLHGVSPYMPPALRSKQPSNGLALQVWSDPTCDKPLEITLNVDVLGSLGKLWMRYRIVFAAFPLLIVALVLRQQFITYDETGIFMSFSQGLNESLKTSIPLTISALTLLSIALSQTKHQPIQHQLGDGFPDRDDSTLDDAKHELLLGSGDVFFWFLVPLFTMMCISICVAINYVALFLEHGFALLISFIIPSRHRDDEARKRPVVIAAGSTHQRVITTVLLLSLISTVIPYHLAYTVLCLEHLVTCARAARLATETRLELNSNFYNYTHSIFILMLWILPINIPVLVVWIRNLTVNWLTPFSPHHNVLSVMPFVLLVEVLSTGYMIPRVQSRWSLFTNVLTFSISAYAALYGVTYAYVLHYLANILCAWLLAIHFETLGSSANRMISVLETGAPGGETKKLP